MGEHQPRVIEYQRAENAALLERRRRHRFRRQRRVLVQLGADAFVLYCRWMESLMGACYASLERRRTAQSGVQALVRAYLGWVGEHRQAARFIFAADATELADKWKDELAPFKQRLLAPIFALPPRGGAGRLFRFGQLCTRRTSLCGRKSIAIVW